MSLGSKKDILRRLFAEPILGRPAAVAVIFGHFRSGGLPPGQA
jgi:hypothetical protein